MLARFDRDEKAWQTITGDGADEIVEFWEPDWSLVEYP